MWDSIWDRWIGNVASNLLDAFSSSIAVDWRDLETGCILGNANHKYAAFDCESNDLFGQRSVGWKFSLELNGSSLMQLPRLELSAQFVDGLGPFWQSHARPPANVSG